MSAFTHEHPLSIFGFAPSFSFYEIAQQIEPVEVYCAAYAAAMEDIKIRERLLGDEWFRHNAKLAHSFFEMKRPWWL